jgi:alanine racemase
MVKAFSYGSGTWEIARRLDREGVDYLAVAYTVEGIALRTRGIRTPILVLNPDDASLEQLLHFGLEPEVFALGFLERYLHAGQLAGKTELPIHLKVDTGMGRLGFGWEETKALTDLLHANPILKVRSVMSHLASADEPSQDAYSHEQVRRFNHFHQRISEATGIRPMRHILNTAGSIRFPQYAFEMVRLGIGLYGVNPAPDASVGLEEIGTLVSHVSQVHEYPAGTYVGYGCSQVTQRPSRIATVAIGYADGIRRSLGNGRMRFLVRGHRVPTFGRICMDMLMLDITDVPSATEGDEVVLMGAQGGDRISANELAEASGTIAYEILTGISGRVQRVFGVE